MPKPKQPSTLRLRDSSDRWILATAEAGGANVLVTGDDDRLAVADESALRIASPRSFWEMLRANP